MEHDAPGKVVLVTGASSGIGHCPCGQLALAGHTAYAGIGQTATRDAAAAAGLARYGTGHRVDVHPFESAWARSSLRTAMCAGSLSRRVSGRGEARHPALCAPAQTPAETAAKSSPRSPAASAPGFFRRIAPDSLLTAGSPL